MKRLDAIIDYVLQDKRAVFLSAGLFLLVFFVMQRWSYDRVINGDVVGYYSYLPAFIIEGDIGMTYAIGDDFYSDKVWGELLDTGHVQKYTMGLAVLYMPFFLLAHLSALLFGFVPNGYSAPYPFFLQLSGIFYFFLGILILRKVLRTYFDGPTTALAIYGISLGTNLTYYTVGQATMPHIYIFACLALLMYGCIQFLRAPSWRWSLCIALAASMMSLIRPNHVLIWLLPLLYAVGAGAFKDGWAVFWRRYGSYVLIWPLVALLFALPQMLYWKHMTGHYLYYSYGDERFFWDSPVVHKVWFSFRNGWLIYSPLILGALVGIFYLPTKAREWKWTIWVTLVLYTYVIASWWCWWYGGCFGQRVYIDLYPLLALGMASLIAMMRERGRSSARAVTSVIVLAVLFNFFQTEQYSRGLIHYDGMTAKAWVKIFGRLQAPADIQQAYDFPDYEAAKRGEERW